MSTREKFTETRLKMGVAKEQARKDLPLSNYTEAYWKIDLHNLLKFLSQRLHPHAQIEIWKYAQALHDLVQPIIPRTIELFHEHMLGAVKFVGVGNQIAAQLHQEQ